MPVTSSRDVECVSYRIIIIRRGEQRGSVHPRIRSVHVIHQSVTHPYKIRIHYFREMYSDRQVLKLRRRFVVRGNCNCYIQARACSLTEKVVPEFRLGYRFSTTNVHPGRRKGIRERLCIVDHWSGHVKFRGRSEYELMSARRFEACTWHSATRQRPLRYVISPQVQPKVATVPAFLSLEVWRCKSRYTTDDSTNTCHTSG